MESNSGLLQLTSSNVPLVFQNPLSANVTSLGYYDQEIDPKFLKEAQKLIESEKKSMPKKDYLENFPMPKVQEHRIREANDTVNLENYKLKENPKTISELQDEIMKVKTLISSNSIRQINLEILKKYGSLAWKDQLSVLKSQNDKIASENSQKTYSVNEINAQRKFKQVGEGQELENLELQISRALEKNRILERECVNIQMEINSERRKKMVDNVLN